MNETTTLRADHVYPSDNKFVTEWYSDRCENGDLRGTRDHYITLRLQGDGSWVVHTGYENSEDYGYCNGDYYGTSFDEAYEGFKRRATSHGFTMIFTPEQLEIEKDKQLV